jgi:hypothetical protein
VVEHLPCRHEALSLKENPVGLKKKEEEVEEGTIRTSRGIEVQLSGRMPAFMHADPAFDPQHCKRSNTELGPGRCQWLIPGVLATQKTEIRRISVRSQPANSLEDPTSKTLNTKKD